METSVLLEAIRARGAVLFGTGFVAERVARVLEERGLGACLQGFLVSQAHTDSFCARPVWTLGEYARRVSDDREPPLLCLAVHASLRDEVEQMLRGAGLTEYVWIYPNYLELAWGEKARTAELRICDLLARQEEDQYWISVRYAALKECLAGVKDGPAAALYTKAAGRFSRAETARRRLDYAATVARSIRDGDYDESQPILIDEHWRVIDGLHRLAACILAGRESIPCRIVPAREDFEQFFPEANRLTKAAQRAAGLDEEEQALLEETRRALPGAAQRQQKPEISVILPVYNVEDYLDQCLESVTGQSFRAIEILLIDDGSKDGSLAGCRDWAARDPRIAVIHRANGGVASARNLGLLLARGEYIAFVDPDDWLDLSYLEKLYAAAREADADYAECDLWRYDNRSGRQIYRSCYGRMGRAYTLAEHMKYGPTATYKAISRRSLWRDNGVEMPSCSFESPAVYSLLLALSRRTVNVREALYYYRRFRENSLIETGYAVQGGQADERLGIDAMCFLIEEFQRTGLYERFAGVLEGVVKYRLSDILAMQYHRRSPENFRTLVQNYRSFLASRFPEGRNEPYVTWGGYNLNRILSHLNWLHDPGARVNFASLAGLLGEGEPELALTHPNRYRQLMLERERTRGYWEMLETLQPRFLFLDLIEERFDLLELDGRLFTRSDAFDGATFRYCGREGLSAGELAACGRSIPRDSDEAAALWETACRRFVAETRRRCPDLRFVIVENYLSESVGDLESREPFAERESIRHRNEILRREYGVLKSLLPEATVIAPAGDELYFTDRRYEYGAIPSHLNEIENQRIAKAIEEAL